MPVIWLRRSASLLLGVLALLTLSADEGWAQQVLYSSIHRNNERAVSQTIVATEPELKAQLAGGRNGISLAVADFDRDGTPDLVTGYVTGKGGVLVFQRGSAVATAPTAAEWSAMRQGEFLAPFVASAQATLLPVRPDLLKAADINGNGTLDLVTAALGDSKVYVLDGDGKGGFSVPRALSVQGVISSLTTWRGSDGSTLIVAGVCNGSASCHVQMLELGGVVRSSISVPSAVRKIEVARLNGGALEDFVVEESGNVLLIDGDSVARGTPQIETLPIHRAAAITTGNFVYDRRGFLQVAVLSSDATLYVLARDGVDSRAVTLEDVRTTRQNRRSKHVASVKQTGMAWTEVERLANIGPGGTTPLLMRGRTSGGGSDDLLVMGSGQLVQVAHTTVLEDTQQKTTPTVTVDSTSNAVAAAVPARISADTRQGLIVADGTVQPNFTVPPTNKTFTVTTTTDGSDSLVTAGRCTNAAITCTLRDAVALANQDATSNGVSKVDTIMIPAGTYTFTTAFHPANDSQGNINYHYDLDASMNLVGAGSGSTIINANSLDKVFSVDSGIVNALGLHEVFLSGMTLENGLNTNNGEVSPFTQNYFGGLMDWESDGTGTLTINNCVLSGGFAKWGPGGAIGTSNEIQNGAGPLEIDNSTVSGNTTPEMGGGIYLGYDNSLLMTNTTVSGNKALASLNASDTSAFGEGGGIETNGNDTSTLTTISNSVITGNSTTVDGGGIYGAEAISFTNTSVTSNMASRYGAGFFVGGDAASTITASTFTGNTLAGDASEADGSGIFVEPFVTGNQATINYSRIHGNTGGAHTGIVIGDSGDVTSGETHATVNATNNWWGCNGAATGTGCDTGGAVAGTITFSPYTTLTISLSSTTPVAGASIVATGSLGQNSSATSYTTAQDAGYFGVPATLAIVQNGGGTTDSSSTVLSNIAQIVTTAIATASGVGTATVTVDGTSVSANFTVSVSDMTITSSHTGNFHAGDTGDTYTLTAHNIGNAASSGTVTVSDTLPAGFTATALSGTGWSCTVGTLTCTRSDALAAGSSYPAITLTVSVGSSVSATLNNVATVSGGGETNTSNDTSTDPTLVIAPPTISEKFTPTAIGVGVTSQVSFTLANPNAGTALTGVGFTDALPTNLKVASSNGAATTCSGGVLTATAGGSSISLTSASMAVSSSCTVMVNVTSASAGSYTNTTGVVTSTNGGTGSTASATLNVYAPPSVTGSFGAAKILINTSTSLSFTISNPNSNTAFSGVSLTDTLPSGLVVSSVVTGSCGAGTITAANGSGTISLANGTIVASGACTFAVNVTGTTAGVKNNSETATSNEAGTGNTSNQSVTVLATSTLTAIAVSPVSPVNAETAVTVSATVTSTLTSDPVPDGIVEFYDTSTTPTSLIGTAELNSLGVGTIKIVPGVGTHTLLAQFQGTKAFTGKTSAQTTLVVAAFGNYRSTEALSYALSGTYTLTDVATFYGQVKPGGTVQFRDVTNGNALLGSALPTPLTQTLSGPTTYASGAKSTGALVSVTGDFNHDGYPDLAVTNLADDTVSVLLGNGDGTFKTQVSYTVGSGPYQIAVGDFNNDGNADLVVTNLFDNTISVLLGKGDGTFMAQSTYTTGTEPYSVAVADLNNDGIADLAVTNLHDKTVGVFLGKGDGTFLAQTTTPVGTDPDALAVADLNGDGNLDLVVVNGGDLTIGVLLGKGDGTFEPQVLYSTGATPYSAVVADFNGDGLPDVAVANFASNTVSVLLNSGGGILHPQVTYATGKAPSSVVALDFDGSGKQSLAVANNTDNSVSILTGIGNGTFQTQVTYASLTAPYQLAVADFSGDGKQDLAVTTFGSNVIGIHFGTQTAIVNLSGITLTGSGTHQVTASYVPSVGDAYVTSTASTGIPVN
ncbi:beta strand repeat-containing protein [Granulicella arctica]|uniref:Putative repeat protein (TIGR01451 family) n=1 Tax=Granulicella arctica TaxID=940613 RepID=A0A7Y9TU49_9BACT|nr:FG-GAP-like repeat-containing protein [Granulicella arctica]NYF80593.1 putative repeat protein (TIGR01451 family) [Granulicella arctica]